MAADRMSRRKISKRPYTPDPSAEEVLDSDMDEIIDVETVQSSQNASPHLVAMKASSHSNSQGQLYRVPPRSSRPSTGVKAPFVVRTAPKITLVGRGRSENIPSASLVSLRNPKDAEIWESGAVIPSKRVPVLADEGIGTLVVTKLPLEEMSMSTRTLRAIQEDHSLSKSRCSDFQEEPQLNLVKVEESSSITKDLKPTALISVDSAKPSTSLDAQKTSAKSKKAPTHTLACAHSNCHSTFSHVDELISHLVYFHCQHQFRPRKLTFVSLKKYELWKASHQKAFDTTMVEHGDREEIDGVTRIHYYCAYCNCWRQQVEENRSHSAKVMTGCPSHFTVSVSKESSHVSVTGCFAHLGHAKKVLPAARARTSPDQTQASKTSPAQCKYCQKWFPTQVIMNRHVRDHHTDPQYPKGTTIECGDPHCDVICDRMSTLCEHVALEHGRDDLVIEEFKFPSQQRFKEWKDQVEIDTMSKYVLSSSRTRVSGVIQSYYLCHLSGYANRSRHSAVQVSRLRPTKKLGRYCTAFMNTKELSDGSVIVNCCLGHFGHSFDVSRLPLPNKVKDEVSELLLKGFDSQTVHDMVRKRYTSSDRGYYLKRYEVRNIADKLRKQGLISVKEREAVVSPLSTLLSDQTSEKMVQDKQPQQSVRFQSIRSLSERGRFSRLTSFNDPKTSNSMQDSQHNRLPRNLNEGTSNSVIAGIRDVSPPIIGPCGYVEYRGDGFEEIDVISSHQLVDDDEGPITYLVDDMHGSQNMLNVVHSVREESSRSAKIVPLLMEPQPTGNAGFDETMSNLNRRINALYAQIKQTVDPTKVNQLVAQVRTLQGRLVRGVPQTTAFVQTVGAEFDGEEYEEEERLESVEHDDTVCLEVEVESSETPYRDVRSADEHYDNLSSVTFEGEPYEEVVSTGYEHPAELYS
ncbi:Zinc finger C2H2 type [Trichostrongylus colubriformis]|uniref:Zinc finger C2H2 type n=1 Tax=Trichostrongylus colubriformis TaxID=6319 RepID=A0AAN8FK33_TRICO